ncbi:MAG: hypothetical protein WCA49_18225 [Candidatus Sulfotelmatobacter sp.]
MHIHPNQINANAQLDALYAADKAAAKREAERTRRKLLEFASELAGEAESGEDCIVQLGAHEEGQKRQNRQNQPNRRKRKEQVDTADEDNSISDWA